MEIKKLNSSSVGTHYPDQALILTDKGEIYVTKDDLTPEGYELLKFQTYDLEQLTSLVNNVLKGVPMKSAAIVEIENHAIAVSPVTNLYKIGNSSANEELQMIVGGYEAQIITIVSQGTEVLVNAQANIKVASPFTLANSYSILLLQKAGQNWIEISRKVNQ